MSTDLQFLAYQGSAQVRQVGLFESPVQTLDIHGEDFADVVGVRVNGTPSPEYIVLSATHLLARVPNSQLASAITEVVVLTARADLVPTSVINFDVNLGGRKAEGQVRLVQSFLKLLLTTPGSDIFLPKSGGGLYTLVGSPTSRAGTSVRADATLAVENTKNQLIQYQAGETRLSDNERLRSATLLAVEFDAGSTTLSIRIRLQSLDGATADAGVTL